MESYSASFSSEEFSRALKRKPASNLNNSLIERNISYNWPTK